MKGKRTHVHPKVKKKSKSFHAKIKVKQATKTTQNREHTELAILAGKQIFQMFQEFSAANLIQKYYLYIGQNEASLWITGLAEPGK